MQYTTSVEAVFNTVIDKWNTFFQKCMEDGSFIPYAQQHGFNLTDVHRSYNNIGKHIIAIQEARRAWESFSGKEQTMTNAAKQVGLGCRASLYLRLNASGITSQQFKDPTLSAEDLVKTSPAVLAALTEFVGYFKIIEREKEGSVG